MSTLVTSGNKIDGILNYVHVLHTPQSVYEFVETGQKKTNQTLRMSKKEAERRTSVGTIYKKEHEKRNYCYRKIRNCV